MKALAQFFVRKSLKNNFFFYHRLNKVKRHEDLNAEEILRLQNKALLKLIKKAYKHSKFYRDHYDLHGVDINSIKDKRDLHLLPIVTKEMVKENTDDILTGNKLFTTKAHTSGTSGSPLMVYRDFLSIVEEEAYLYRHREKFGHKVGMKSVILRGDLDRQTFKLTDPFTNTKILSSFRISEKTADAYFEEIASFSPHALMAYPSSVEILANFLLAQGKSLNIPLIFTSSETLYNFQREKIQKAFNCRVVDWYGNAERSIALEENPEGTYDELPLYSINEYNNNNTITTGLINTTFPLIRYEINDVFISDANTGKVDKIIGRMDDAIDLPDGTKIGRLDIIFKGLKEIMYAQIIQDEFKELTFNIVPSPFFNESSFQKIQKKVEAMIGKEMNIKICLVTEEDIIKTDRGKYKLVINNLNVKNSKDILA